MREQEHIDGRREAVLDYLDGTLTDEHSREFARHLSGCARCREAIAEQRKAMALLAAVQSAEPPLELEQQVLGRLEHRMLGQIELPARVRDTGRRRISVLSRLPAWLRPSTLLPAAALLIFVGVGLVWFTQSDQADDLRSFQANSPADQQESTDQEAAATAQDSSKSSAGDEAAEGSAAEDEAEAGSAAAEQGRDGANTGAPEEARALDAAEQSPRAAPGEVLNVRLSTGTSPEEAAQIFESITTLRAMPSPTVAGGAYLARMLPEDIPLLIESLSEAGLDVATTVTSSADLPAALSRAVDATLLLRPRAGGEGFATQPFAEDGAAPEDTVLVVALTG